MFQEVAELLQKGQFEDTLEALELYADQGYAKDGFFLHCIA